MGADDIDAEMALVVEEFLARDLLSEDVEGRVRQLYEEGHVREALEEILDARRDETN